MSARVQGVGEREPSKERRQLYNDSSNNQLTNTNQSSNPTLFRLSNSDQFERRKCDFDCNDRLTVIIANEHNHDNRRIRARCIQTTDRVHSHGLRAIAG